MKKPSPPSPRPPKAAKKTAKPTSAPLAKHTVPIVGMGTSAGGLEALEQFLAHVPPASGLAFVVVQHLDPTHKGVMAELLQRTTPMPVVQIKDRMKAEPDHVYIIPPNFDLSILHGVLHLLEPAMPRGHRLPIDLFFRSLADDQQAGSIGVILSGMGSDGTLGLRAIKEKGGVAFVQTPASAKFDGMPRSVINAGLADIVAPAEELAGKIADYVQHVPLLATRTEVSLADADRSGLEKILLLLRAQTGHDFSLYKKSTLYRRIERRMGLHQLRKIEDYVRYLRGNPQESDLLFRELLIGVTSFFRDPPVWEQLKSEVIPALLAAHPTGGVLRAWIPGCSTGEEAYSLAIVFSEVLEQTKPSVRYSLQIFATDLDDGAIDTARIGFYPANIAADVSEARLNQYFVEEDHGYRVSKPIREMVIFAPQNLVMDPPFTKLDLLSCRNLLIYLEPDLQKKLIPLFHYSLNPKGILVLGSAETVGQATDLFAPLPGKTRIYRRLDGSPRTDQLEFPASFSRARAEWTSAAAPESAALPLPINLETQANALLLQHYSPAAVLTTEKGDIVYIKGKTGKYLEPAAGKASLNIFAMTREGLSGGLHEIFTKAIRQKTVLAIHNLKVIANGSTQGVDITVHPLTEPATLQGMVLVVFADVSLAQATKAPGKAEKASASSVRLEEMTRELRQSREELQSTREEMQTSQEELKSTNEELQSTNEELQSTNEELTTSKEEMQSMNEELQTVNHELQAKVDELSQASDDMKNLLNSTDIATLFLDDALRVRRFTTKTTSIIKLIPGDAGRPITDIATELDYPDMCEDARQVLRTLLPHEQQVAARNGRWYKVRIMPYRTQDNRIDGVVITFVDIAVAKAFEITVREALSVLGSSFTDPAQAIDNVQNIKGVLVKTQTILENALRLADKPMEPQKGRQS
jgi:two-component system, chemotaxis family, CheB/CheR fusion protein